MSVNTSFYVKDPNSNLDYEVDWTTWLAGDTITASTFTVVDVGIVLGSTGLFVPTFTTTKTKVWVSGGTLGLEHRALNHITTAQGRQEDQTLVFIIDQK